MACCLWLFHFWLLLYLFDVTASVRQNIWAATWQNQQNECAPSEDSDQLGHPPSLRLRSAWASAQSYQSLCCPHEESLGPYLPTERTAKTPIRLGGCLGWSESSLGAYLFCWFCHVTAHFDFGIEYKPNGRTSIYINDWKYFSLVARKPVFGLSDLDRLKSVCAVTETGQRLENTGIETRGIILSMQRTTKALIRLRGCAGWSAPLLFAYGINRFSHDVAHLVFWKKCTL